MHIRTVSHVASLCFSLGTVAIAHAATCARPKHADISGVEHIFVAQITSARLLTGKGTIEAAFEVEEVLKGNPANVASIQTEFLNISYASDEAPIPGTNLHLSPGMHFLVVATGQGPALYSFCSETIELTRYNYSMLETMRRKARTQ